MKKYLLLAAMFITLHSFSQEAVSPTDTEQYCILRIEEIVFSNKISIDVDFGQSRKPLRDNRLRDEETKKLKKFNSEADALNYMGQLGWKMVNAFPVISNKSSCTQYVFKKNACKETALN
jgi:hypothetical protein